MSRKFKRRNYFIKKDFQGKMILGFFLLVMGSIILFAIIFGIFSADSITISYKDNNLQIGQTPMMLFKNALAANWVFIIFGGSLLVLAVLLISHHIAGPQYRFEKALQSMLDGNLNDPIHLRPHDEGSVLADRINEFNTILSAKLRQIDRHVESIDQQLELINASDLSASSKEISADSFRSIRDHNAAIRKVIASFTLPDE